MRLSDTDYDPEMRGTLEQVLEQGEEIRWCGSPDGGFPISMVIGVFFFSLAWVAIPAVIVTMGVQEDGWSPVLILPLAFMLVGLLLPLGMLRYRKQQRRAVYVLTEKRAVLLEPKMFSGVKVYTYPVEADMLQEVRKKKNGSGSLVFDYSDIVVNGKPQPRGFLYIRDVEKPLALLREMGVKGWQESFDF